METVSGGLHPKRIPKHTIYIFCSIMPFNIRYMEIKGFIIIILKAKGITNKFKYDEKLKKFWDDYSVVVFDSDLEARDCCVTFTDQLQSDITYDCAHQRIFVLCMNRTYKFYLSSQHS